MQVKLRLFLAESLPNMDKTKYVYRITNEIAICNEIYKKADIKIKYDIKDILVNITVGDNFFFNSNLKPAYYFPIAGKYQLSDNAQQIFFNKQIREYQENNLIKVYYITQYHGSSQNTNALKGLAIPSMLTSIPTLKNSIILGNMRSNYTLAHEISHILLNSIHDKRLFVPENNIFKIPANEKTTHILGEDYKELLNMSLAVHPACRVNQVNLMRENANTLALGLL